MASIFKFELNKFDSQFLRFVYPNLWNQNIESVFLVHHYYNNQNIKSVFLVHHYYDNQNIKKNIEIDFQSSDFTYGVKKDQNIKNWKPLLPMAYYLWLPRPVGG